MRHWQILSLGLAEYNLSIDFIEFIAFTLRYDIITIASLGERWWQ